MDRCLFDVVASDDEEGDEPLDVQKWRAFAQCDGTCFDLHVGLALFALRELYLRGLLSRVSLLDVVDWNHGNFTVVPQLEHDTRRVSVRGRGRFPHKCWFSNWL